VNFFGIISRRENSSPIIYVPVVCGKKALQYATEKDNGNMIYDKI
jgi:hypothetical protein